MNFPKEETQTIYGGPQDPNPKRGQARNLDEGQKARGVPRRGVKTQRAQDDAASLTKNHQLTENCNSSLRG